MSQKIATGAEGVTVTVQDGVATVTLKMSGRVNKINAEYGELLSAGFEAAMGVEGLVGVIIASGHKDFCAGADLDVIYQVRDPARIYKVVQQLNALYRRIETAGVPVVALCGALLASPEDIEAIGLKAAFAIQNRPVSLEIALKETEEGLERTAFMVGRMLG